MEVRRSRFKNLTPFIRASLSEMRFLNQSTAEGSENGDDQAALRHPLKFEHHRRIKMTHFIRNMFSGSNLITRMFSIAKP